MTPQHPRQHDTEKRTADDPGADSTTTDCAGGAGNPVDARLKERLDAVSRWHALLVGALTVVLANEVTELLPLGDTASVLALFPVTLAVLYGLLTLVARLEKQ
ncbi:hypothetical protein [Halobacterium rubrum]|uniref:hypothetical protein n=1 Tax=Halobacterium TaxID=2239 RepID=UPI001F26D313|nr:MULTISPECIES: hypothetical protein [Halobacterium]MDH5021484.1 hypothetical protein [Halobacterium rubrum]